MKEWAKKHPGLAAASGLVLVVGVVILAKYLYEYFSAPTYAAATNNNNNNGSNTTTATNGNGSSSGTSSSTSSTSSSTSTSQSDTTNTSPSDSTSTIEGDIIEDEITESSDTESGDSDSTSTEEEGDPSTERIMSNNGNANKAISVDFDKFVSGISYLSGSSISQSTADLIAEKICQQNDEKVKWTIDLNAANNDMKLKCSISPTPGTTNQNCVSATNLYNTIKFKIDRNTKNVNYLNDILTKAGYHIEGCKAVKNEISNTSSGQPGSQERISYIFLLNKPVVKPIMSMTDQELFDFACYYNDAIVNEKNEEVKKLKQGLLDVFSNALAYRGYFPPVGGTLCGNLKNKQAVSDQSRADKAALIVCRIQNLLDNFNKYFDLSEINILKGWSSEFVSIVSKMGYTIDAKTCTATKGRIVDVYVSPLLLSSSNPSARVVASNISFGNRGGSEWVKMS